MQPFEIEMTLDLSNPDSYITIPAYNTTEKEFKKKQKFNRAKEKKKFNDFVEEELSYMEEDEWER